MIGQRIGAKRNVDGGEVRVVKVGYGRPLYTHLSQIPWSARSVVCHSAERCVAITRQHQSLDNNVKAELENLWSLAPGNAKTVPGSVSMAWEPNLSLRTHILHLAP